MKHFIHITDLSIEEIQETLERTLLLKKNRTDQNSLLRNQTYGLLFYKRSTRTRVSFEVGIQELGANVLALDSQNTQISRGESIKDTAIVLSRYLHGLVIRSHEHNVLNEFAKHASMPIINGLTDFNHPCQVLTDIFTLLERYDPENVSLSVLKNKKIVFLGDTASNMANSWILASAYLDFELVLAGPKSYEPTDEIIKKLNSDKLIPKHRFTSNPSEAVIDADVLYTDVWVSMGDEGNENEKKAILKPYQVNSSLMKKACPEALFLHCLPAHVGEEVTRSVIEGPQSIIYDQAENRLHTQKSIIAELSRLNLKY